MAHIAFLLASIWNHLEQEQYLAAQALVGRGMASVDQLSRGGAASLGFLWTHLPEPPWGVVERPAMYDMKPYSLLVPPALVAASVAYLKDLDAMAERLGQPTRQPRGPREAAPKNPKAQRPPGPKGG